MSTILGTKGPTLQPKKFGYSKERGHYDTRVWEGGEDEIRGMIPAVLPFGVSYDCEELRGGLWRLTVNYSSPQSDGAGGGDAGGDQIAVTWELLPKDAQKPLLGSWHTIVSGLDAATIDKIRAHSEDKTYTTESPAPSGYTTTDLAGNALKIFKLLRAGVDTVEVEQPVLTLTWIVPDDVNLAYSYANIGRVYTTASLISAEAIPSYISTSMTAWTSSFSNPTFGSNRVSLVFGWKKRAPTQRLAGENKREITQTWEYGFWATDIYGATV